MEAEKQLTLREVTDKALLSQNIAEEKRARLKQLFPEVFIEDKIAANTDAGGCFHANWLNMMYPRLYLAKNLLREDVVFTYNVA